MVGIGCHALEAEQDQRFQRPHVLPCPPKLGHIIIRKVGGADGGFLFLYVVFDLQDRLVIEVHVGDGGKQSFQHQLVGAVGGCPRLHRLRKADQRADDFILIVGGISLFAAHPGLTIAPGIVRRLLALETKHLLHVVAPLTEYHYKGGQAAGILCRHKNSVTPPVTRRGNAALESCLYECQGMAVTVRHRW